MHPIQIEECLRSMEILVDTREQKSERAERRYKAFNCPWTPQHLDYGDYAYNFTLPDGNKLFNPKSVSEAVYPDVVIERKEDLSELSKNLCQGRDRFHDEFNRAKVHSASVYLLVENATWENLINGRYGTKFHPNAYLGSLTSLMARYHLQPIFCKQETSGRLIHEILYRELKRRLEDGFYG